MKLMSQNHQTRKQTYCVEVKKGRQCPFLEINNFQLLPVPVLKSNHFPAVQHLCSNVSTKKPPPRQHLHGQVLITPHSCPLEDHSEKHPSHSWVQPKVVFSRFLSLDILLIPFHRDVTKCLTRSN